MYLPSDRGSPTSLCLHASLRILALRCQLGDNYVIIFNNLLLLADCFLPGSREIPQHFAFNYFEQKNILKGAKRVYHPE